MLKNLGQSQTPIEIISKILKIGGYLEQARKLLNKYIYLSRIRTWFNEVVKIKGVIVFGRKEGFWKKEKEKKWKGCGEKKKENLI